MIFNLQNLRFCKLYKTGPSVRACVRPSVRNGELLLDRWTDFADIAHGFQVYAWGVHGGFGFLIRPSGGARRPSLFLQKIMKYS